MWTGRVEISSEQIPGSRRSTHDYVRTCSRFKSENLWAVGSLISASAVSHCGLAEGGGGGGRARGFRFVLSRDWYWWSARVFADEVTDVFFSFFFFFLVCRCFQLGCRYRYRVIRVMECALSESDPTLSSSGVCFQSVDHSLSSDFSCSFCESCVRVLVLDVF